MEDIDEGLTVPKWAARTPAPARKTPGLTPRTLWAIWGCRDAALRQDDPRTSQGSHQDATGRQEDPQDNPWTLPGCLTLHKGGIYRFPVHFSASSDSSLVNNQNLVKTQHYNILRTYAFDCFNFTSFF